jgi:hypothetical protein
LISETANVDFVNVVIFDPNTNKESQFVCNPQKIESDAVFKICAKELIAKGSSQEVALKYSIKY